MKTKMAVLSVLMLVPASLAAQYSPPVSVRGHVTREGVYVPPHVRTAPNETKADNWSSRPNVNPYTGRAGTVDPYAPPKPYNPYKSPY